MKTDDLIPTLKQLQLKAGGTLDTQIQNEIDHMPIPSGWNYLDIGLHWAKWVAILLLGLGLFWVSTPRNVAWAQVTERFATVPYVRISLNLYQPDNDYFQHMDLWLGQEGRLRLETQSQRIYAEQGQILQALDQTGQTPIQADAVAHQVIENLGSWQTFSLETVIQAVLQGALVDITPAQNLVPVVGQDLAVFEGRSNVNSGRVRVYALRRSQLPVSLRIWDTSDGLAVEATMLYEKEPLDSFFAPQQ